MKAVTALGCEYNLPLDYLCPMCLVLIILITASTAQDSSNSARTVEQQPLGSRVLWLL